ncbi:unnamed protein product, partial [Discosporangium mesarthrocarpum]
MIKDMANELEEFGRRESLRVYRQGGRVCSIVMIVPQLIVNEKAEELYEDVL